jgi:hypothetical protein
MPTLISWIKRHRKELGIAGGAFLGTVLLFVLVFYTPKPALIDPPTSTKEAIVTLKGKVAPHRGVVVFNQTGDALVVVNSDDKGEFTLNNIPIGEGKNVLTLRSVASRYRLSLPLFIVIQKDTTAPALSMNTLQGATVTGSNTIVSGKAEPGSTVMVNGVKTTVGADGTWTATVALKSGSNTVTVAATDSAGNTTTDTQTIQYAPTAADSQTGTATVTSATSTVSVGSTPAPAPSTGSTTSTPTGTTSPTTSPTATPTPTPTPSPTPAPAPTPAPQPVLAIVATASISNASPNERANETITVTVKDNYGRPVMDASVIAAVHFKNGTQNYSLSSLGNGVYTVNFKLNDHYERGYRVGVDVTARYNGFVSTAYTSFTPM